MINNSSQYLGEDLTIKNERELVRAVLQAYLIKSVGNITTDFETVILDRIMSWRVARKKKTSTQFGTFFFISFFTILVLSSFSYIENYITVSIIMLISLVLGVASAFYMFLYFVGIVPLKKVSEVKGFKNAISDLFFQTWSCVQIVYYKYLFVYVLAIVLIVSDIFSIVGIVIDLIDKGVFKIATHIYNRFDFTIEMISFKYILLIVLVANIVYILSNLFYVVYYVYFRKINTKKGNSGGKYKTSL